MKRLYIMLIVIMAAVEAHGQSLNYSSDKSADKSFMRIGLRYKSDYFYMGRSDSAKAPYLIPSIGYYHKSGLFISGAVAYLVAQDNNRIDLSTVSIGYDYFGEKFATGVALDQYFFSDKSYAIQAEMNTYVSAYVGYDFDIFMAMIDGSLGFSESTDKFLSAELSKTFYMLKNKLLITPAVTSKWGTQYYYNEYYTYRSTTTGSSSGGGKGKGSGSNGTTTTTTMVTDITTSDTEKFQMLDYELSLQTAYKINQLRFFAGATWLFPINPSTITIDEVTYEEDLNTGFLWSMGVRYNLK